MNRTYSQIAYWMVGGIADFQRHAQREIGVAAACFVPCDLGLHAWSLGVFTFAQTPPAIMPNLHNPWRVQCLPLLPTSGPGSRLVKACWVDKSL